MMDGVRGWLLALISAAVLCAVADCLMPAGPVKRIGKLVCGLVLLCAVLQPVVSLDLAGSRAWLESWCEGLELRKAELEELANEERKIVIEQEYAAYIVDKAADMGLTCTAGVRCRTGEAGLPIPDEAWVSGRLTDVEQSRMTQLIWEDLGVPAERQAYYIGEGLP